MLSITTLLAQAEPEPITRRVVPLALALIVLLVTAEMIRRRQLREEYAMLWLGASVLMLVFAIFPSIVIWLSRELKVNYLTIVVLGLFLFLALIVMHFAMVISRQSEEIRQLAQRMAILSQKLQEQDRKRQSSSADQERDGDPADDRK